MTLVAGDLALDFANSESGRGHPSHQDHFQSPADVADWLAHAGALDATNADHLRARLARDAAFGAALFAKTRRLRDDVHAIGAAVARNVPAPDAALASLAARHARCLAYAALVPRAGRRQWRWTAEAAPLEAALGPVALAAVTLLTDRDAARVKECGGLGCGWLFYDATKNGRRRWCEMKVCGNRAKQRRLAARSRGA